MELLLTAEAASGFNNVLGIIADFCLNYGLKILGAILVLIVGLYVIKLIIKLMEKSRWFKKIDKDVQGFSRSAAKALLYVILVVTIVAILGVPMASIIAVIASCGVAVGLALQGSLSNLAGGLMLLLFKPFHVGDYIVTSGYEGTVQEIGIFSTALITIDNRRVVIPNAGLSNSSLVNVTHFDTRRIDIIYKVDAKADTDNVISVLRTMAEAHDMRLADKPVEVRFDSFGEGCAKYIIKVWCKTSDYWELYYALMKDGKQALADNGINVPLPQIEVHSSEK